MLADFKNLMAAVYRGEPDASQALISEYGELILRGYAAISVLSIRSQFDSTDFVQEVWLSFLKDLPKGRVFETPSRLGAFLVHMARNKVVDAIRHTLMLAKNNVNPRASLEHQAAISNHSTPSTRAIRVEIQNSAL